jgi:nucleoid DNA-binding protein
MKRSDLIEEYANEFGITKKEAEVRLDWVEDRIVKGVKSGDEVVLSIGKFEMKKVPARMGRNPKTGESMKIVAKKKPVFKATKKFKDALS